MHQGHQGEEDRGHGCEWLAAGSLPYLEQLHCGSSVVDRLVTRKSFYKSMVEPNRSALGISSKSGDGHGRGALHFSGHNMHPYRRWRKNGVGDGLHGIWMRLRVVYGDGQV